MSVWEGLTKSEDEVKEKAKEIAKNKDNIKVIRHGYIYDSNYEENPFYHCWKCKCIYQNIGGVYFGVCPECGEMNEMI